MNTEQKIVIGGAIALVLAAALWELTAGPIEKRVEITPEGIKLNGHLPKLWVFYNTSEVNSRHWYDFGARSSRVLNIPLLNMMYETIAECSKNEYRVEVIGGLEGVASLLGGWDKLPRTMQYSKAAVTVPEEDWIRNAILAKYGGLWLSPSVICLRQFGSLPMDKVIAFGQDDDGLYGSNVPGFRAIWSPRAGHEVFVEMEKRCRERLEGQLGGRQVRGDAKSDWVEVTRGRKDIELRVKEELGRDPYTQKKLELEDLLAAGTEGNLPFTIPKEAVYVAIPYRDLLDRRVWGWILRMSEEQILESDIVIKYLLNSSKAYFTQRIQ